MKNKGHIELLARGVCVKDGKLLLCHTKGAGNTYLPGGHVEFMESAKESLLREIEEELGCSAAIVGRFLGAVEHTFIQKRRRVCEINLVFELDVRGIDSLKDPASCEGYIDFQWVPMNALAESKLEPAVLRKLLSSWLKYPSRPERWASTL